MMLQRPPAEHRIREEIKRDPLTFPTSQKDMDPIYPGRKEKLGKPDESHMQVASSDWQRKAADTLRDTCDNLSDTSSCAKSGDHGMLCAAGHG